MNDSKQLIEKLVDEIELKIVDVPRMVISMMIHQCFDMVGPPDSKQRELFTKILSIEDREFQEKLTKHYN